MSFAHESVDAQSSEIVRIMFDVTRNGGIGLLVFLFSKSSSGVCRPCNVA